MYNFLHCSRDYFYRGWIVDNTENKVAGSLEPNNTRSGLIGNITQYSYIVPDWINITKTPFFEYRESLEDAQKEISQLFEYLNHVSAHHIANSYLLYEPPDSGKLLPIYCSATRIVITPLSF